MFLSIAIILALLALYGRYLYVVGAKARAELYSMTEQHYAELNDVENEIEKQNEVERNANRIN